MLTLNEETDQTHGAEGSSGDEESRGDDLRRIGQEYHGERGAVEDGIGSKHQSGCHKRHLHDARGENPHQSQFGNDEHHEGAASEDALHERHVVGNISRREPCHGQSESHPKIGLAQQC